MKKYGYLAVEGQHDLAFVGRLLKPYGLSRVTKLSRLDTFWRPLVPPNFPHKDDLLKRMPVPTFFESATHSLAVHVVEGDGNFGQAIKDSLDVLEPEDPTRLSAVGVLLDADGKGAPRERATTIASEIVEQRLPVPVQLPQRPGEVSQGPPRAGIFVLPDNVNAGTLEALLVECARATYPQLTAAASTYLDVAATAEELQPQDRKDFDKPSGLSKALVACVAAVLRPGKAIQVPIQDNRWLEGPFSHLPRVQAIHDFLVELFELKPPAQA